MTLKLYPRLFMTITALALLLMYICSSTFDFSSFGVVPNLRLNCTARCFGKLFLTENSSSRTISIDSSKRAPTPALMTHTSTVPLASSSTKIAAVSSWKSARASITPSAMTASIKKAASVPTTTPDRLSTMTAISSPTQTIAPLSVTAATATTPTSIPTTTAGVTRAVSSPLIAAAKLTSIKATVDFVASSKASKSCKRKENIVYLKTHKTASSAVQNILLRYGLKHKLKFAMPLNAYDFDYPGFFYKGKIAKQGPAANNIICHHMRFNYEEIRDSMPKNSVFVTILREPGRHFESCFEFFWPLVAPFKQVPHHSYHSMERWLDNAAVYLERTAPEAYDHLSKNPSMFDLGFDNKDESRAHVISSVAKVYRLFDFVMIADYFAESMVLLADLLCWNLEDVACLSHNVRNTDSYNFSAVKHLRIRKKARKWNKADGVLFDFFNATFWIKVEEYGHERMKKDVEKLHEINDLLLAKCIEGHEAVDYSKVKDLKYKNNIHKPDGVKLKAYNLKKGAEDIELCNQLIAPEVDFSKQIFKKQELHQ